MQVLLILIEWLLQLLVGAALLRAWMNGLRINMRLQPGLFVMALTDWLVKPLRRWMPQAMAKSRLDWGSVLAALLWALVYSWALMMISGLATGRPMGAVGAAGVALVFLLRTALQTWSLLLIAMVILSWVQPASLLHHTLTRVMAPLVAPFRRALPLVGGVDLSPALVLLLLQLAVMLLP
jgi:YggT family protein